MSGHGHAVEADVRVTRPDASRPREVVSLAQITHGKGLEQFTVREHPYQRRSCEARAQLSVWATDSTWVGAEVIHLTPRPPAVPATPVPVPQHLHRQEPGHGPFPARLGEEHQDVPDVPHEFDEFNRAPVRQAYP